jgi:hypothetical protein
VARAAAPRFSIQIAGHSPVWSSIWALCAYVQLRESDCSVFRWCDVPAQEPQLLTSCTVALSLSVPMHCWVHTRSACMCLFAVCELLWHAEGRPAHLVCMMDLHTAQGAHTSACYHQLASGWCPEPTMFSGRLQPMCQALPRFRKALGSLPLLNPSSPKPPASRAAVC